MLNVKALTWAFALTAALVFSVCVAYGLMVPPEYNGVFGGWLVGFHGLTLAGFLIGLAQVVGGAILAALAVGLLNNYFHRRWEMITH